MVWKCAKCVSIILTGTKNRGFHAFITVILYPMDTKVYVGVTAYHVRLHTKFEENRVNHFCDMSKQTLVFFHFFFLFFVLLHT